MRHALDPHRAGRRRMSAAATTALLLLAPIVLPSAIGIAASAAAAAAPTPVVGLTVVRQSRPNSCGPAAVATLATWLGRTTTEAQVLDRARLEDDGVTLAEFARLADAHGAAGSWYRVGATALAATPTPFVAHLDAPDEHFVVVHAVALDHVVVGDPAVGAYAVPLPRFARRFSGRVFLPREAW